MSVLSGLLDVLSPHARRRRRMRRAPVRAIGDAKSGELVRLRGVVRAVGKPLALPFADELGVFHVTHVGEDGATFSRVGRREIVFEDVTGWARIHIDTPVDLIAEEKRGGTTCDAPALAAFVGRARSQRFAGAGVIAWRQRRISVGDEVSVWGRVVADRQARAIVPAEGEGAVVVEVV